MKPFTTNELKIMADAHEEQDELRFKNMQDSLEEKFQDTMGAIEVLHNTLLNPQDGKITLILQQTTKHNGRLTKVERVMLVIGTAVIVLFVSGNPTLAKLISSFI